MDFFAFYRLSGNYHGRLAVSSRIIDGLTDDEYRRTILTAYRLTAGDNNKSSGLAAKCRNVLKCDRGRHQKCIGAKSTENAVISSHNKPTAKSLKSNQLRKLSCNRIALSMFGLFGNASLRGTFADCCDGRKVFLFVFSRKSICS